MMIDEKTDQVWLTHAELTRIRKHAARHGEVIHTINCLDDYDLALIKACSVEQLESLIDKIEAHTAKK